VSAKFGEGGITPMQTVLLRSESSSSSEIENLTVGAKQLALANLGGQASHNAQIIARNVAAMEAAIRLADDMSVASVLLMHEALMKGLRPDAGMLRDRQVWIGRKNSIPPTASYVPPRYERVPDAMADLMSFAGRVDIPVLAQVAIAHAQFESIHPFTDGNGRTGRALMQAMLRNQGLTRNITVPISSGLLVDTEAYFDALTAFRQGDAAPIVANVTRAAQLSAGNGKWLVDSLENVLTKWGSQLKSRTGSSTRAALPIILSQPAINVEHLCSRLGGATNTAARAITALEQAEILKPTSDKRRNRVWIAPDAITVMDEFARRLGRRTAFGD
jgi:Fic family protein